jgi:hypothetical protein
MLTGGKHKAKKEHLWACFPERKSERQIKLLQLVLLEISLTFIYIDDSKPSFPIDPNRPILSVSQYCNFLA